MENDKRKAEYLSLKLIQSISDIVSTNEYQAIFGKKTLSYNEAVQALHHTIAKIGKEISLTLCDFN